MAKISYIVPIDGKEEFETVNSTLVNMVTMPEVTPFRHLVEPLIIANGKTVEEIYFFNQLLADQEWFL